MTRRILKGICSAHDRLTRWGFAGAVLCVAVMATAFCYEVAARYFFNAPTDWANPLVSYLLCATVFLAAPELTRQAAHIAITILTDRLAGTAASAVNAAIRVACAFACLLAAWFSLDATLAQYAQGIWTNPPFAVPKWAVSAVIPYAMASASAYFLRQLFQPPAAATAVTGP